MKKAKTTIPTENDEAKVLAIKKTTRIPWNKGKTGVYSEETRKRISSTLKRLGVIPPYQLGYRHTQETKKKMSISHKGKKHGPMSDETRRKISMAKKGVPNLLLRGIKREPPSKEQRLKISRALSGKMPKNLNYSTILFGNVKRGYYKIGDKSIFFRSKWEANYALYLNFLIKQKQIKEWEYEPDVFIFHKIQFGTRSYRPDFKIINIDGSVEYHEIKGWMTKKSQTQIKRMKIYYPKVKLVIIDKYGYKDIKNKVGKMLNFY